jgi:hypothetical protein
MIKDFAFDVFLSHTAKDKPRVRRIAVQLRAAGLKVWFDEWTIAPGEDIYLAIERGLETSRRLVLFISPAALGSDWVGLERSTTLFRDPANTERRFLPVLLADCTLPDAIRRYRYIDLRTESEDAFAQLLAACKGESGESPAPTALAAAPSLEKPKRYRAALRKPPTHRKATPFTLLSLGSFLAGLALLWVFMAKAELLVRLGLEGKLYYLVLLPLGLAVAAFLFGVLRSYAQYRGEVLSGTLELGGPVVVFCLVVLVGLSVRNPESFLATVFVHGEGGMQDLPLRGQGFVVLDLGPDRRREPIGEKGQAFFPGIPASFRDQEVPVWVEAEGYVPVTPIGRQRLDGTNLYLAVKRLPVALRGRVEDSKLHPLAGVRLGFRDLTTTSRADGSFVLEIPGHLLDEDLYLDASAPGYQFWREPVVPDANDVVVQLKRTER